MIAERQNGQPEVVISTDPGLDDALAISKLKSVLKQRGTGETALISSHGNVSEDQAYNNLLRLARIFRLNHGFSLVHGLKGPMIPGHERYASMAVYKGNGNDGLWEIEPPQNLHEPDITSYNKVGELNFKGVKEIISLAPLTNIVLVLELGARPKKVLIMAGAFNTDGNVKPVDENGQYIEDGKRVAEWNSFKDPQALKRTLNMLSDRKQVKSDLVVNIVPMDAGRDIALTSELIIRTSAKSTIEHRYMKRLLKTWAIEYGKINPAVVKRGLRPYDLIAVLLNENPDFAYWAQSGVEVITKKGQDLGRTVLESSENNFNIALSIRDLKGLFEAVCETIFGKIDA